MGETAFGADGLTWRNPVHDVVAMPNIKRDRSHYNENDEAVVNGLTRKEFMERVDTDWKALAGVSA